MNLAKNNGLIQHNSLGFTLQGKRCFSCFSVPQICPLKLIFQNLMAEKVHLLKLWGCITLPPQTMPSQNKHKQTKAEVPLGQSFET